MTHFTPAEFVDAAEGTLHADRLRHAAECEPCRLELAELTRALDDAADGPVPEPSPLFWAHFSARVRDAVAAESAANRSPGLSGWLRWPALLPLAGLALVVLAAVATLPRSNVPAEPRGDAPPVTTSDAPAAHETVGVDAEWHALAELVGPLEWEAAGEAGLTLAPGDTELAMLDLSDDERRELTRLLVGELARGKS